MMRIEAIEAMTEHVIDGAGFSVCGKYRYWLKRHIGTGDGRCVFIMLNPSTADELSNDPTVRRCMGFARTWGFSDLIVLNLFAYRATDPEEMKAAAEPIGPNNDDYIEAFARSASFVVCAWGNHGAHMGRSNEVRRMLRRIDIPVHCFNVTGAGEPVHPLYQPRGAGLSALWPPTE